MSRAALPKSFYLLRFPAILILLGVMLYMALGNISTVVDGLGLHLFNSARYEEATRMEMEFNDLIGKSYRYVQGAPDVTRDQVDMAFDILWSRATVVATKNYQHSLAGALIKDSTVAIDLRDSLPEFEKAMQALHPGDRLSFRPLLSLATRFHGRINALSNQAYVVRRTEMLKMVAREIDSLAYLKRLQSGFAMLTGALFLFVVFELVTSYRNNHRLRKAIDDSEALLVTDVLTGIGNRRGFEADLEARPIQAEFSLLMLDLDGFKAVNDTLGHAAGDALLKHVADVLSVGAVAMEAMVARLGGDEFAVILSGSKRKAVAYGEAVRQKIDRPIHFEGKSIQVTASIGIAHSSETRCDNFIETLLKHADLALYTAKAEGRNRVRFTTPAIIVAATRKRALELDLPMAIRGGEVDVAFQPIMTLANGGVESVEALVRWEHPRYGAIPAPEIVQAAESVNQILPMTLLVLRRACETQARFAGLNVDARVAVNLSPDLLAMTDFAAQVLKILSANDCAPNRLMLELTEDVTMTRSQVVDANLEALRAAGISLSVDDFGTGYSNLSRLVDLEFAQIKLDKSLVARLKACRRTFDIVRHVASMAADLGMDVVAEGVETDEDWTILTELNIPLGQGYRFARPMSAFALLGWMANGASVAPRIEPNLRQTG